MKNTRTAAVHSRAKTITFNPDQLHLLQLCVQTEMDDPRDSPNSQTYYNELRNLKELLKPGLWLELYRSVSDDGGDFELCQDYVFSAREINEFITAELLEAKRSGWFKKIRIKDLPKLARKFRWAEDPEFVEFDSNNPSHACGYWSLRITGPAELEEAIEETRGPA